MFLNELINKPFKIEGGGMTLAHDKNTGLCRIESEKISLVAPISELRVGREPLTLFWNNESSAAFAVVIPSEIEQQLTELS